MDSEVKLTKVCTRCKIDKELDQFYKNKGGKFGVESICKICRLDHIKDYRKRNKDKIRRRSKVYYDKNIDKMREYSRSYYDRNRDKKKDKHKDYREKNRDSLRDKQKVYYRRYKDKRKEYYKIYSKENREKIKEYHINYNKENTNKIKECKRAYYNKNKHIIKIKRNIRRKIKYKTDPLFKFSNKIRTYILISFKKIGQVKTDKTFNLLGYSMGNLKGHLSCFLNRPCEICDNTIISFEENNYHIDHILPMSSALNESDVIKLNQLSNLRLICSKCNLNKIPEDRKYIKNKKKLLGVV